MGGNDSRQIKGFYEDVRKMLYLCRIVGFLPISGLSRKPQNFSRCSWALYALYYISSMTFLFFGILMRFSYGRNSHDRFKELGYDLKYSIAGASSIFLLKFSLNWQNMISEIEANERLLPPPKNPERIAKNCNRIVFIVIITHVVEYIVNILFDFRMFKLCFAGDDSNLRDFYTVGYKWMIDIFSFHYYIVVVLVQVIKFQAAFVYNFADILVLAVTLHLVYRFRNFNRLMRLRQLTCVKLNYTRWSDLQAHYTRLGRIVKIIDDQINPFILLSFLSNILFICKIIYDVIQKQKQISHQHFDNICSIAYSSDWVAVLDLLTSIVHLLIKTALVSGMTAHLHTLSREPLNALHTIPQCAYNLEMQRFMDQVYHTQISLSGLGIFKVTRGTILSMLSTIITYELVIIQLPIDQFYKVST